MFDGDSWNAHIRQPDTMERIIIRSDMAKSFTLRIYENTNMENEEKKSVRRRVVLSSRKRSNAASAAVVASDDSDALGAGNESNCGSDGTVFSGIPENGVQRETAGNSDAVASADEMSLFGEASERESDGDEVRFDSRASVESPESSSDDDSQMQKPEIAPAYPRRRVSSRLSERYQSDEQSPRLKGYAKRTFADRPKRGRANVRNSKDIMRSDSDFQFESDEGLDFNSISPDKIVFVNDYISMQIPQLREVACELGLDRDRIFELKKQELVTEILKCKAYAGFNIRSVGTLEILPEGSFGFLRSEINSYLPGPEDVFVSPQLIKSYALKTGDVVSCMLRNPQASERFFAVQKILSVNDCDPALARGRVPFDSLTPLYPDSILNLEGMKNDISMRIVNLFAPIGKGQRALITAPPRTGKTILLQKIANAITDNYPDIKLLVLLVDERPEEVTDMRRNVKGEVIASTFDEQAQRHVSVAEMVIEKAKRQVEYGKDVVILLDSITRLARAYNQTAPASGKVLSGGVDSNALHKPKRFFGAARNIENGGSLTIIASALIETGSRMDEVIFEEFKGTGNCEIVLDRRISDKRVYPAINLKKSGTRKEELLINQDDLAKIWLLRNAINSMDDVDMTEFVIEKMRRYESNQIFLGSMMNSK